MKNETNLKYEIADDIISLLGLARVLSYTRQAIYGDNRLAESQASKVREKAKSEQGESEALRESFIEKCMPSQDILIEWLKENEDLIRKQQSVTGTVLLNQLKEKNLI